MTDVAKLRLQPKSRSLQPNQSAFLALLEVFDDNIRTVCLHATLATSNRADQRNSVLSAAVRAAVTVHAKNRIASRPEADLVKLRLELGDPAVKRARLKEIDFRRKIRKKAGMRWVRYYSSHQREDGDWDEIPSELLRRGLRRAVTGRVSDRIRNPKRWAKKEKKKRG